MGRDALHIELKTPEQIGLMRRAGLVVADTLAALRDAVAPGISTGELDELAEERIRAAGAVPSFLGYHGYPASICASVNEQVVHAIPSRDQVLREGDVVSIDCGAVLDDWHGDAAITVPVGRVRPDLMRLLAATEEALWAGIRAAARSAASGRDVADWRGGRGAGAVGGRGGVGGWGVFGGRGGRGKGRLTDISAAIEQAVRRSGAYGIVEGYGGHGIGSEMHQDPFVENIGRAGHGPSLVPGMALALEPMVTLGRSKVVELDDGWTVVTADGSPAAHFEHTMAICDDGVWVLTAPDGGRGRLGRLVTAREPG